MKDDHLRSPWHMEDEEAGGRVSVREVETVAVLHQCRRAPQKGVAKKEKKGDYDALVPLSSCPLRLCGARRHGDERVHPNLLS